jgi:hypothetical protein
MPATTRSQRRRQPARPQQPQQRRASARSIEPPDYSRDYADVLRDLRMIAIIGGLLFIGMVATYFIV